MFAESKYCFKLHPESSDMNKVKISLTYCHHGTMPGEPDQSLDSLLVFCCRGGLTLFYEL